MRVQKSDKDNVWVWALIFIWIYIWYVSINVCLTDTSPVSLIFTLSLSLSLSAVTYAFSRASRDHVVKEKAATLQIQKQLHEQVQQGCPTIFNPTKCSEASLTTRATLSLLKYALSFIKPWSAYVSSDRSENLKIEQLLNQPMVSPSNFKLP